MTDLSDILEVEPDAPEAEPLQKRFAALDIASPFVGALTAFALLFVIAEAGDGLLGILVGILAAGFFLLLGITFTVMAFFKNEAPGWACTAALVNLVPTVIYIQVFFG